MKLRSPSKREIGEGIKWNPDKETENIEKKNDNVWFHLALTCFRIYTLLTNNQNIITNHGKQTNTAESNCLPRQLSWRIYKSKAPIWSAFQFRQKSSSADWRSAAELFRCSLEDLQSRRSPNFLSQCHERAVFLAYPMYLGVEIKTNGKHNFQAKTLSKLTYQQWRVAKSQYHTVLKCSFESTSMSRKQLLNN